MEQNFPNKCKEKNKHRLKHEYLPDVSQIIKYLFLKNRKHDSKLFILLQQPVRDSTWDDRGM